MSELLRVLIVEDAESDAQLAVRQLQHGGYDVVSRRVETAEGLRTALAQEGWDLVLCDYTVPGFGAPAALAIIREHQRDLPVIVVSGTVGEEVAVTTMKAGAHDLLLKANLTRLVPAVQRELREAVIRREQRQAAHLQDLASRLLARLNEADDPHHLIRDIMLLIKEFTGFDAIGVRLREGDDFPYYETNGLAPHFVEAESSLCRRDAAGAVVRDARGRPCLECMCGNVLQGRTNPALPFFTASGSFWTNSTTALLANTTAVERQGRTRNRCHDAGYESVALIPLRSGEEIIGLLQLNDRRQGMFTPALLKALEGLGASIGIALARQRAAEALRHANEHWRGIFDSIGDMIIVMDRDRRIVAANQALRDLLPGQDPVGQLCYRVIHGLEAPPPYCPSCTVFSTRQCVRVEIQEPHLGNRWLDVRAFPVTDEHGDLHVAHAIADITDRKQAEPRLRESEARYRTLFEDATDGMALADAETGRLVDCNRALCRLVERDLAELRGQPQAILHPPQGLIDGQSRSFRQHRTGSANLAIEDVLLAKSGKLVSVEIRAAHVAIEGRPCLVGIFRDITERKRAEEGLREANTRLTRTLAELQATQAQMVRQERLHALGQMASGIAHDFNNQLAIMQGLSELLLNDPASFAKPAQCREYVEMIHQAAKDAAEVIGRVREFYRSRNHADVVTPVDLGEIVRQAVAVTQLRWQNQASAAGIAIAVETHLEPVPALPGVAAELREALTNLIFNAVDAMPRGGTISISLAPRGNTVVLAVRDTGVGMPPEVKAHCGEPFFTTKGNKGTGLGLAEVQGILRRHEAVLDITSAPGQGTTIAMTFPVPPPAPAAAPAAPATPATPAPTGVVLRILLVDDERGPRLVATELLAAAGHTVTAAASGREGLDRFRTGTYDLVITDRAMPDFSGDQLAQAIKQLAPEMPIILLTGFGGIMQTTGERPTGVDLVLGKPVTLDQLRGGIARVVKWPSAPG